MQLKSTNNTAAASRQSNIELLRILAMCAIIILHYNNAEMGGAFSFASGVNLYILYVIECIAVASVDLFVIISGYFLCTTNRRIVSKPASLVLQLIFFNTVFYVVNILIGEEALSAGGVVRALLKPHWFITLYVALYFISPLINMAMDEVEKRGAKRRALMLLIILFSFYPGIVDLLQEIAGGEINGISTIGMYGSQHGYTIVNMAMLYFIGAYIRKADPTKGRNTRSIVIILAVCIASLFAWMLLDERVGYFPVGRSAWSYCNPLVVASATGWFMLFQRWKIKNSRVINALASGSFTVLLVHVKFLRFIRIERFVQGGPLLMTVHLLVSTAAIFLAGCLIWFVYRYTIGKVLDMLLRCIPVTGYDVFGTGKERN